MKFNPGFDALDSKILPSSVGDPLPAEPPLAAEVDVIPVLDILLDGGYIWIEEWERLQEEPAPPFIPIEIEPIIITPPDFSPE